jgi:hypothetical protein
VFDNADLHQARSAGSLRSRRASVGCALKQRLKDKPAVATQPQRTAIEDEGLENGIALDDVESPELLNLPTSQLQVLALFVLRQDPFGQGARAFGQDCRHAMRECNSRALRPRHALVEISNSSL